MASSSSAQARSIVSAKLYDVFISHRGPDVKETLAKQLYDLLQARQCRAFLDREEIQGGDSIDFAIYNAICSSRVQVAIFSKGYAESSWCLDELVVMLQQNDAIFIPVFYDVQPWELRHIDNEKSQYATAFSDYQRKRRNLDKLHKWKSSLESASYISGYELSQYQDNLCEKIVSRVIQVVEEKKNSIALDVAKYPVGLAELVQDFERSCSKRAKDKVTIIGIFGLGGVGKSTLAKELFNRKSSGYHTSCFLSDVRESHAKGKLHCLQSQLLKDLFPNDPEIKNLEISSVDHGKGKLRNHLGRARHLHFLIILDDIDHEKQLDALLPEGMLSSGSLVIITTRDQSVLRGADIPYKLEEMGKDHAKLLFCKHAFGGQDLPIAYEKLVEDFVKFCGCLPLSLVVLGAHVYRRDEHYWELELEKVRKIQPKDIMQSLKISFDGLDREEKQIFIDIACLFNKKERPDLKSDTMTTWKASGWSAEHAVQTLQDKCLLELVMGQYYLRFEMHDHLCDLGRQMANDLGPPRLWRPDFLRSMEANGFAQILAETKGRCFHSFKDSSLQTIITYFIGSSNDSAESDLLWLDIDNRGYLGCKLENIPSWIPLRKLHNLSVNCVGNLWSAFQKQLQTNTQASFELRVLKICYSQSLEKLPDLIAMFNHLEELNIGCSFQGTDITSLMRSLKQLSNLRSLSLWFGEGVLFNGNFDLSKGTDSTNLDSSTSSRMNSLETIELNRLDNISKLLISREICPRLQSLKVLHMGNLKEMHLEQLERLNTLEMWECPKLETISGLSSLTRLQVLKVEYCYNLDTLSLLSSLTGLQSLKVLKSLQLEQISELSSLTRLQSLRVWGCDCKTISGLSSLTGLQSLELSIFQKLETISGLSFFTGLQSLTVKDCPKLETISELSSVAGLKSLRVSTCPKLKTISGLSSLTELHMLRVVIQDFIRMPSTAERGWAGIAGCGRLRGGRELPQLESVEIEVPDDRYAWVRNCLKGPRPLSGYAVLTGMPMDAALFELNENLFCEVDTVIEIEKGEHSLEMESSSSAISIYALLVRSGSNPYVEIQSVITHLHSFPLGKELMITILQTPHRSNDVKLISVPIEKGFRARVNEGEEVKALVIMQRIIDRLYKSQQHMRR